MGFPSLVWKPIFERTNALGLAAGEREHFPTDASGTHAADALTHCLPKLPSCVSRDPVFVGGVPQLLPFAINPPTEQYLIAWTASAMSTTGTFRGTPKGRPQSVYSESPSVASNIPRPKLESTQSEASHSQSAIRSKQAKRDEVRINDAGGIKNLPLAATDKTWHRLFARSWRRISARNVLAQAARVRVARFLLAPFSPSGPTRLSKSSRT